MKKQKVSGAARVALVTGASSGIGAAVACRLAAEGYIVYAAARRVERMTALRELGIQVLPLDVTEEASLTACVAAIEAAHGGVDVLVNNAGYGAYGAVEELPLAEARRQLEVNVLGAARLVQLVLPQMRARRWGRIINISSVAGQVAAPYGGWYHASKFALEGLSAALRQEVAPFGVRVVLVRPGAIRTEWGGVALEGLQRVSGHGPYRDAVQAMVRFFSSDAMTRAAAAPEVIAEVVVRAAAARCPRHAYTAPRLAGWGVALMKGASLIGCADRLMRQFLGLPRWLG